jgi:hypothetical protein
MCIRWMPRLEVRMVALVCCKSHERRCEQVFDCRSLHSLVCLSRCQSKRVAPESLTILLRSVSDALPTRFDSPVSEHITPALSSGTT